MLTVGCGSGAGNNKVEIFDIDANTWAAKTSFPYCSSRYVLILTINFFDYVGSLIMEWLAQRLQFWSLEAYVMVMLILALPNTHWTNGNKSETFNKTEMNIEQLEMAIEYMLLAALVLKGAKLLIFLIWNFIHLKHWNLVIGWQRQHCQYENGRTGIEQLSMVPRIISCCFRFLFEKLRLLLPNKCVGIRNLVSYLPKEDVYRKITSIF